MPHTPAQYTYLNTNSALLLSFPTVLYLLSLIVSKVECVYP